MITVTDPTADRTITLPNDTGTVSLEGHTHSYLPLAGGTLTGDLLFEGATADDYETTLTVTNPTADRTVTLPNNTGTVVLDADIGSSVQAYDADTAKTDTATEWTAGQRGEITTVTPTGSPSVASCALDDSNNFEITLTATAKIAFTFPSTAADAIGQSGVIYINQNGTGAPTFDTVLKFPGGSSSFTPSSSSGKKDMIVYFVKSATEVDAVYHVDMS